MLPLSLRTWSRITHLALRLHSRRASDLENGPWACKRLEFLSIQRLTQVWVKYGGDDEQWVKFNLEKKGATPTLPTEPKNSKLLPVKPTKVVDVKKLVDKYVPMEYQFFKVFMIVRTETRKFDLRQMRVTIINDLELDYYISS